MSIEKLRAEAKELLTSIEARRESLQQDKKRYDALIFKAIHLEQKQKLERLIGVEGGVHIGYCHTERLRGKKAKVLKVNRSRALVMVEGEEWLFPFSSLKTDSFAAELELKVNGCIQAANQIKNAQR